MHPAGGFREAKNVSVRVLFDSNAVVHFVNPQNLCIPAVAPQLVILAHDERLDRLGGAHFGAQAAKTATRQVEVEVVENLDLLARLPVAAEGDQVVGARLGALVADDAGLGTGGGLDLQAQDSPEPWRRRPALRRVLKGERRLWRVLQGEP